MLVVIFSDNFNFSEDDHDKKNPQELDKRDEVNLPEMIVPCSGVPLGSVVSRQLVITSLFSRGLFSLGGDWRNDGELLHSVVKFMSNWRQ